MPLNIKHAGLFCIAYAVIKFRLILKLLQLFSIDCKNAQLTAIFDEIFQDSI